MTTVSLIVPCYNAEAFLAATIESVIAQDMPDWELILIDDGSSGDATFEIIQHYATIDSRISGFRKHNEGTSRTRNYGFERASPASSYLFFLDHDDQLMPSALSRMRAYMDAHPDVGLLTCQFEDVAADGRRLGTGRRSRWAPGVIFPHELRDDEVDTPFATFFCATGQGPFAMYRRSVYERTEGWETGFWPHEDTDMCCQMALLAKVHCLPDRLYLKRIHPSQGMNDAPRLQRAGQLFRAKWDNRQPKNEREAGVLRDAKKYYYAMHLPCRDLKVAVKACGDFFARPSMANLRWFLVLIGSAVNGFVRRRFKV